MEENAIVKEVMENNEEVLTEAVSNGGSGKGFLTGLGVGLLALGAAKLISWGVRKRKAKKKAKEDATADITQVKIDPIPYDDSDDE